MMISNNGLYCFCNRVITHYLDQGTYKNDKFC